MEQHDEADFEKADNEYLDKELTLTVEQMKKFWDWVSFCALEDAISFAEQIGVTNINELFILLATIPWIGEWKDEKPLSPGLHLYDLISERERASEVNLIPKDPGPFRYDRLLIAVPHKKRKPTAEVTRREDELLEASKLIDEAARKLMAAVIHIKERKAPQAQAVGTTQP